MTRFAILALTLILAVGAAAPARAQYDVPTPSAAAPISVTAGWWFNPAEGGSGYGIASNANGHIFFGAYGYSDSGSGAADWMYSTLTQTSTNVYFGTLSHCTGGQMLSSATFVAAKCAATSENIQLTFTATNAALLQFSTGRSTQIQPFTTY